MARRGRLNVTIIGVAKSGWALPQLIERAKKSVAEHGATDDAAFAALQSRLQYVDGDYNDAATFVELKRLLGDCRRPAHYLAIPPSMFETVTQRLAEVGAHCDARIILEKPFGRDLDSARALN